MRKSMLAAVTICSVIVMASMLGAAGNYTYDNDIKTILNQNACISCHQYMGVYAQLSTSTSVYSPTNGLKIVYSAKPDSSVLIWRIEGKMANAQSINIMPLGGDKLSADTIQKLRDWITQGLPEKTVGVEDLKRWGEVKRLFR